MQEVTYFYLSNCPYCMKAGKAMEELVRENPVYGDLRIRRIDEGKQPDLADSYDYYFVPTMFIGEEKCYEADPSQGYDEIRENVKRVFDLAVSVTDDRIQEIHDKVREYYSAVTKEKGGQLASAVCTCASNAVPDQVKQIVSELPDEIIAKYYGCGSPVPDRIEGLTLLDLGCGTGRDVYVASKLAGASGRVIGIDMNDDQLDVARKYQDEMGRKRGYDNVIFKKGYIEDLKSAGVEDASVDVVISNCVINLSPDKRKVFAEIRRVLRDGGVLYFSDMFADRHVPEEINTHPLLLGECLGGALSEEEFENVMKETGWNGFTVISSNESPIENEEIEKLIGDIRYYSKTIRAVKGEKAGCCQIATPFEAA
ncbi:MAG: methyltransferase domain-containing protein [Lachnospiraceae bacterium]|nr:methyltransferase domain-containing protein [Lachnospiraceae bacterium]